MSKRFDKLEQSARADRNIRQRLCGWPHEASKAFEFELAEKYKYVR
jgi:hypothetical protein